MPSSGELATGAIGARIREERLRRKIGVRDLARRVGVSASLISQVELGRASPSVGTLYAIVNVLGLSLDSLLLDRPSAGFDPVVRRGLGQVIKLDSGVTWERLTPPTPQEVDFVSVFYEVGGESCPAEAPVRHSGREYGYVLTGRLGVTIGFDTHELGCGDSISFDSTMPHRLFNAGDAPAEAIWFVVGRRGDPRIGRGSG